MSKSVTYGWYGPFFVRELATGDLQIAISEEDRRAFREEVDADEYEYPDFSDVIDPIWDEYSHGKNTTPPLFDIEGDWDNLTLAINGKKWAVSFDVHPCEALAKHGFIEFIRLN